MKGDTNKQKGMYLLGGLYFAVAFVEVLAELFAYQPLIYIFKPLMPATLILLYWFTSEKRNWLFVLVMFLSLVTNLLFIPDSEDMLLYGLTTFMIHRILVIYYVIALLKIKDFIPVIIGTVPFLMIFFYLFFYTDLPEESFLLLIIQNILISIFCGIAFSHYMMNDNKKNSWLLLCGILFGCLQFIVFVEKFYLMGISPGIFRPIAMGLNAFAFYTLYEFVVATEKSDDNGPAY